MFKSINAKIFLITFVLLVLFVVPATLFSVEIFISNKQNVEAKIESSIANKIELINRGINRMLEASRIISFMGESYYRMKNQEKQKFLIDPLVHILQKYPYEVYGGVFYEPYRKNINKKHYYSFIRYCPKKGLKDYTGELNYDYLQSEWYKDIKNQILSGAEYAWLKPYVEEEGVNSLMTSCAHPIKNKNGEIVGFSIVDVSLDMLSKLLSFVLPSDNSDVLIADTKNDFILVHKGSFTKEAMYNAKLKLFDLPISEIIKKKSTKIKYKNINYICYVKKLDNGMHVIVSVPEDEIFQIANKRFSTMLLRIILISIFMIFVSYFFLAKSIKKPIMYMQTKAKEIGDGNLNAKMKIDEPTEFKNLADIINTMTDKIKENSAKLANSKADKKRMESELNIAKSIQMSSLPHKFPPYPNRDEFEIYAKMEAAKIVGGDFYDFFFIDDDNFAFLIADVSGKGVPAALFMMKAKALIKNTAMLLGPKPAEIVEMVNSELVASNSEKYFATLFFCIINLKTGKLSCVNAGHNVPYIRRVTNKIDTLRCKPNLVIGVKKGIKYNSYETKILPSERILLYTDGVTEAQNKEKELYTEQRLLEYIKNMGAGLNLTSQEAISEIIQSVHDFTQGEEQSDDITMLSFRYKQNEKTFYKNNSTKITVGIENYRALVNWFNKRAEFLKVSNEIVANARIAIDEIYANVLKYAYSPEESGEIELVFDYFKNDKINLKFVDYGVEFNPLEKADPDVTLPLKDRPLGGLGIYMTKQTSDGIVYERIDDKNILTVSYNLNS